jgi:hypothetical protein
MEKKEVRTSIIVRFAVSICLLILFHVFFVAKNIWHYNAWSDVLALFCSVIGFSMFFQTLRDYRDLTKKGRVSIRGDERTRIIFNKSGMNAFFVMIVALPFLATFFSSNAIMDVNLFAAVLIIMGSAIFFASVVYYNR